MKEFAFLRAEPFVNHAKALKELAAKLNIVETDEVKTEETKIELEANIEPKVELEAKVEEKSEVVDASNVIAHLEAIVDPTARVAFFKANRGLVNKAMLLSAI